MPTEVQCDVCCLVYDVTNPRSFEFVARIYLVLPINNYYSCFINPNIVAYFQKYYANANIPVLIAGNKSETPSVRQDYILQPESFCSKHKVRTQDLIIAFCYVILYSPINLSATATAAYINSSWFEERYFR